VLALLGAHFLGKHKPYLNRKLAVGLLSAVFGFLIANPYALLDLPNFLNGVAFDLSHYRSGHPGYEGSNNWLFYLSYLLREGVGPGIFLAATGGLALTVFRRETKLLFLSLFPLVYFILISDYRVRFVRTIMPVVPFLSLMGAYFLWEGLGWLRQRLKMKGAMNYLISGALLLAVVIFPFVRSLQFDIGSSRISTRTLASQWIEQNIPKGSKIASNQYSTVLGDGYLVLELPLSDYPFEFYKKEGYSYLVFSSGDYGRFFREPIRYAGTVEKYRELFRKGKPVKSFEDDPRVEEFLSPKISIYRVE
jgi:hypothetical protein